jgi:molybdopterin converting factor small subunit
MPSIYLPTPMRKYNKHQAQLQLQPGSLVAVFSEMQAKCPGIREAMYTAEGHVKPYINVFVNGDDIRSLKGSETLIGERDEVHIVPAMAGG